MGARVAVASDDDGGAFVRGLGADKVVDGYKEDVLAAARQFAPSGLDAVLLTTGGEAAEKSLAALNGWTRRLSQQCPTRSPLALNSQRLLTANISATL